MYQIRNQPTNCFVTLGIAISRHRVVIAWLPDHPTQVGLFRNFQRKIPKVYV